MIIKSIKRAFNYFEARLLTDELFVKKTFLKKTGRTLSLSNPQTFSEKIQWLKLYYRNPVLTKLADKLEAKKIISKKIGEEFTIPTVEVYESGNEILLDFLPKAIALKATHGSGWNIISKNSDSLSQKEVQGYFTKWLSKNYYIYSKEWAYKAIKPRVICEELLFDESGNLPMDYKFFCFDGIPRYIQVDHNRFEKHTRSIYDNHWHKKNFTIGHPIYVDSIPKPPNFNEMLKVAEALSKELPFLRVDLFNVDGKIYCGELTMYPGNGMEAFSDIEWDYKLGRQVVLPKEYVEL